MNIDLILGLVIILLAYGFMWFLLIKSLKIVNIIDEKGLQRVNDIKEELFTEEGDENNG